MSSHYHLHDVLAARILTLDGDLVSPDYNLHRVTLLPLSFLGHLPVVNLGIIKGKVYTRKVIYFHHAWAVPGKLLLFVFILMTSCHGSLLDLAQVCSWIVKY